MKYARLALLLAPALVVVTLLAGCDSLRSESSFGNVQQLDTSFPIIFNIPETSNRMLLSFGGDVYATEGDETFWIYENFVDFGQWEFTATQHTNLAALGRPDDYDFSAEIPITDSSAFAERRDGAIKVRVNRVFLARPYSDSDRIVAIKMENIAATDTTSEGSPTGYEGMLLYSVAN